MKAKKVLGIWLCLMAVMGVLLASSAMAAGPVTMTGTVVVADQEAVLETSDGEYVLDGENMTQYDGKTVKVVGTVEDDGGAKYLVVDSIEEVE